MPAKIRTWGASIRGRLFRLPAGYPALVLGGGGMPPWPRVLLVASGLALLYPSLTVWGRRIREKLHEHELHATVAVGFTRFGTYALARAKRAGD